MPQAKRQCSRVTAIAFFFFRNYKQLVMCWSFFLFAILCHIIICRIYYALLKLPKKLIKNISIDINNR